MARNSDVELVIRAKNEADRTIKAVSSALASLVGSQDQTSASADDAAAALARLERELTSLAKYNETIARSVQSANDAISRQAQALVATNQQITDRKAKVEDLTRALEIMNAQADKAFIGPKQNGLDKMISATMGQLKAANADLGRLTGTFDKQLASLQKSRSDFRAIGASQREVESAVVEVTAKIANQTAAMEANTVAARKQQAAQQFFNTKFAAGLNSGTTTASDREEVAAVLRVAAARDEAIQKLREQQAAEVALAQTQELQARAATLLPGQGIAGSAASDRQITAQTSVFAELQAAEEREAAAKQKEIAASQALIEKLKAEQAQVVDLAQTKEAQNRAATLLPGQGIAGNPLSDGRITAETSVFAEQQAALEKETAAHDKLIERLKAEESAQTELAKVKEAQSRAATLLPGQGIAGGGLSDGSITAETSAFAEAERAAQAEAAAIQHLKDELNPLAVIEKKLADETARLVKWQQDGKISAGEFAAASVLLKKNADAAAKSLGTQGLDSRGRPSLFGLKPYELQNLGYQINDIVTQLASGTSITQTFAQQGGQLLQLFPRIGAGIVAAFTSAPIIAATVLTAGFIAALVDAEKQITQLREFNALLAANADGANIQASALVSAAKGLDRYGLSAADAIYQVRLFVKEGLDPARYIELGRAAKDLADITGTDLKQATQDVTAGFIGGYDAVKKLDDAYNFLTSSQREVIRQLFDEGQAGKARITALDEFSKKMQDAADKARGPWAEAFRSLGNAWDTAVDKAANSAPIQAIAEALNKEAKAIQVSAISLFGPSTADDMQVLITAQLEKIRDIEDDIAKHGKNIWNGLLLGSAQNELKHLQEQLKQFQQQADKAKQQADKNNPDTTQQDTERQKKIDADLAKADEQQLQNSQQISNERRVQIAYEKALADAQTKGASDQAAIESARKAAAREYWAIEKEVSAEKDKQAKADEQAIKSFSQKVAGVESGNDPNASNPQSSALGLGQFVAGTWLDLFKKTYPEIAQNLTDDAILALRKNADLNKQMIEVYARDNAEILKKAGLAITDANLYITHFLGASGGKKLIDAPDNQPTSDIFTKDVLNANKSIFFDQAGNNRTAQQVRSLLASKISDTSIADSRGTADLQKLLDKRAKAQEDFNAKLDDENEKRQQATSALADQTGLIDEQLLAAQKQQAIDDAVLQKRQEVDKINQTLRQQGLDAISLSDDQLKAIKNTTAAYFDLAHAKELAATKRTQAEQPVSDLTAERDLILSQIAIFQQTGKTGAADQLEQQFAGVSEQLDAAIAKAKQFYATIMQGGPQAAAALGLSNEAYNNIVDKSGSAEEAAARILGVTKTQLETTAQALNTAGTQAQNLATKFIQTGAQINETFASQGTSAVLEFGQAVAQGEPPIESLKTAFLSFASQFLQYIAQMIIQQAIFNAIGGASGSGYGGIGGSLVSIATSLFHEGGVVGAGGKTRFADPALFLNAKRFHMGGLPGLQANEVPAILKKGEEVLTQGDPRNVLNGGGAAGSPSVKIVNTFDSGDFVSQGLSTKVGETAFLNFVRTNRTAIKRQLG